MANFDDVFEAPDNGKMAWREAVNILHDVVRFKMQFMNDYPDDYPNKEYEQAKLQDAWSTILRGV